MPVELHGPVLVAGTAQQMAEALHHGAFESRRQGRQFLRVDLRAKFGKNRGDIAQPSGGVRIAQEVEVQ